MTRCMICNKEIPYGQDYCEVCAQAELTRIDDDIDKLMAEAENLTKIVTEGIDSR